MAASAYELKRNVAGIAIKSCYKKGINLNKCHKLTSSIIIDKCHLPDEIEKTATFDEILVNEKRPANYYYNVNIGGDLKNAIENIDTLQAEKSRKTGVIWLGQYFNEYGTANGQHVKKKLDWTLRDCDDIHVVINSTLINDSCYNYRDVSNAAFAINNDLRVRSLDVIEYDRVEDDHHFSKGLLLTDFILSITTGRSLF
jgi:hypothetical protein